MRPKKIFFLLLVQIKLFLSLHAMSHKKIYEGIEPGNFNKVTELLLKHLVKEGKGFKERTFDIPHEHIDTVLNRTYKWLKFNAGHIDEARCIDLVKEEGEQTLFMAMDCVEKTLKNEDLRSPEKCISDARAKTLKYIGKALQEKLGAEKSLVSLMCYQQLQYILCNGWNSYISWRIKQHSLY